MARLLWPTLIGVAVVVAVTVSAAGEQTRTELAYLDEIRAQAADLARSGSIINEVMSRIAEINREEFTTAFDSVTADLDVALEFVAQEPPTESLVPVWALYRQSVESWSGGVNSLAMSILQAADNPEDDIVFNTTGDALAELRTGDHIYQDLQGELERDEIPRPVSPLIDVRMSPTDTALHTQSVSYVNAARRSTSGLGLRPGLRVSQVVTDPEWEVNVDREAVIPATETVGFSTVITNAGNVASEVESVQMNLVDADGGEELVAMVREVVPLQPNGQVTIQFPEVEVAPDIRYTIIIELQLSHPDADPNDNLLTVDFTVNAP